MNEPQSQHRAAWCEPGRSQDRGICWATWGPPAPPHREPGRAQTGLCVRGLRSCQQVPCKQHLGAQRGRALPPPSRSGGPGRSRGGRPVPGAPRGDPRPLGGIPPGGSQPRLSPSGGLRAALPGPVLPPGAAPRPLCPQVAGTKRGRGGSGPAPLPPVLLRARLPALGPGAAGGFYA